jgi:two-component system NarL family response regulator
MKPKPITRVREPKIRILIVDDHQLVREGIRANVNPAEDMSVVAEAGDGVEALARIKKLLPDIVLLDLRMPQMDGLEMMAHLKAAAFPTKVIIMTTFETEVDIFRSVEAGARGYLTKDSSPEEIVDAIRQVNAGDTYLPARIAQKIAEALRKPQVSRRELEVLYCVAAGKSNKEIAVQLSIAEGTVKTHVRRLLEKLGSVSRTAAVREAVNRGLVRLN